MNPSITAPGLFFLAGLAFTLICGLVMSAKALGDKRDRFFAAPRGDKNQAARYSLTWGMAPWKKETAYRHWPTYVAGIGFHAGIFLGFAWTVVHILSFPLPAWTRQFSALALGLAALLGLAIFVKRLALAKMRALSNPDDYFSNLLVTTFLILSALALHRTRLVPLLLIWTGIMFFYLPLGKLRHALFFVPTRVLLGRYFGSRGTWPKARSVS